MISILIPIFNFDTRRLVNDLVLQGNATGIPMEILCFDDGSDEHIKMLHRGRFPPPVIYREMPENLGRSAIRNALAAAARFPYLLFMDCDSKVVGANFIQNYVDHLAPNTLLYGGRCYNAQPPEQQHFQLHWKYGRQREQSTVAERNRRPWHSFMTNNFLVPKAVLEEIHFDERLRQYGHEDTLFGLQLAQAGIQIKHLDNPLEHIGLEPAEVFLEKTDLGLQNLHLLWRRGTAIDTKLLNYFKHLQKWGLSGWIARIFYLIRPILRKQLLTKNPNLRCFDFYKLGYLCWWDLQSKLKHI